jgi:hypothetical protein
VVLETTGDSDAAPRAFAHAEAALLADALGVDLAQIAARTREPLGAGSVAGFDVRADGHELRYYVDTSRFAVASETGLARGDPASPDARIWLHPGDPHLPALAAAAFGDGAEALLARLGIASVTTPTIVAYRPGRRAVLRVSTAHGRVWIKVVRPSRAQRIADVHTRLGAGGIPVPHVLGWAAEGLVVVADAHGVGAPDVAWDPDRLLDTVDGLRAQLADVQLEVRVQGAANRLPWYSSRLRSSERGTIERDLARLVARMEREVPPVALSETTVHGDLHFGQLFLDADGAIATVIDVDTAGLGDPAEDSAAFIAHAVASALLTATPEGRERVWCLADAAHGRWAADSATRLLTTVHLVGHAIGACDRGDSATGEALVRVAETIMRDSAPSTART